MKRLMLAILLGLGACGDTASSNSPEASLVDVQREESADTTEDTSIAQGGCEPGSLHCVDETSWASCTDARSLGEPLACEGETRCLEGYCRPSLCTPGVDKCVSWTVKRRCDESGLRWSEPEACGTDEVCHEGQCLTCFPSQPTCATLFASAQCSEDGTSFPMDAIESCGGDKRCHEASGVCLDVTCSADEQRCSGSLGSHRCLPSATRFSPEVTPCSVGEICTQGACIPLPCTPHPVLFVVDRSSALGGDWASFEAAIQGAQDAHPGAAFGFMPFPMAFGCPPEGPGDLPRFPIELGADIASWFESVSASAGEAALGSVFDTVLDRVHEIFASRAGRIILISSGDAECDSDPTAISAAVTALRIDHGVRTFVIGHRASSGPYDALDAAHAAGGSTWGAWRETSYDLDLKQAIDAAMADTPSCE